MKTYTTKEIEEVLENMQNGIPEKRITDIFYRRIAGAKNPNLFIQYTNEEMIEFARCYKDPFYFFENYCKILTHEGFKQVKLRKYQREIIQSYFDNKFNIVAASRQSGMTTVISLINLYNIVFETEKTNVIFSSKAAIANEKIQRVAEMYINLPFFMKPGVTKWNMDVIEFDNGCRVLARSSMQRILGFQTHRLFVDDFAYIPNAVEFFRVLVPTLSALRDSKMFISSAPNGQNLFYDLLTNAERKEGDPKKNSFVPHRVYWWEVPGRDVEWKNKEVYNLGSSELFDQSYDLQFTPKKVEVDEVSVPIVIKLQQVTDRSDLMSMGFSRIDGLPIYRYTGSNFSRFDLPYTIIQSIDKFF
jgi:hypothetical protein